MPTLYSFRRCPYAMRSRLAIAASGRSVTLREVVLRDKPADLLLASPKGTVPVLVLEDGTVIDQSLDIMRWAMVTEFSPESVALITANDTEFKQILDRYKYPERHPEHPQNAYRQQGMAWIERLVDHLRPNLGGAQMDATDWALLPFVRQFAAVDPEWFERNASAAIRSWLDRFVSSAHFLSVMEKYPQWRAGEPGVAFPA